MISERASILRYTYIVCLVLCVKIYLPMFYLVIVCLFDSTLHKALPARAPGMCVRMLRPDTDCRGIC